MTMIREAIEFIIDYCSNPTVEVDGRTYSTRSITPVELPNPQTLSVSTLASFIEYINSFIDLSWKECNQMIIVQDEETVKFVSEITDEFAGRYCLISASACLPTSFKFERYLAPDEFLIGLLTRFDKNRDDDLEYVIKLCSNIKIGASMELTDNGISQDITTKKGVSLAQQTTIKSPVCLSPYRTFGEIVQPTSQFILRADDKGNLALFESDGGAWKIEAMKSIKCWLSENSANGSYITMA